MGFEDACLGYSRGLLSFEELVLVLNDIKTGGANV